MTLRAPPRSHVTAAREPHGGDKKWASPHQPHSKHLPSQKGAYFESVFFFFLFQCPQHARRRKSHRTARRILRSKTRRRCAARNKLRVCRASSAPVKYTAVALDHFFFSSFRILPRNELQQDAEGVETRSPEVGRLPRIARAILRT